MPFVKWRERWARKRALRSFVRRLGVRLAERYGAEPHYSVGRVRATIEASGLDLGYLEYACAMYSSKADYVQWKERLAEEAEAQALDAAARAAVGEEGDLLTGLARKLVARES